MQEQIVIKKEELDIDDTKIKLELDEDAPQLELPCGKYACLLLLLQYDIVWVCVLVCVRMVVVLHVLCLFLLRTIPLALS